KFSRAHLYALAAVCAFVVVDVGAEIVHMNGIVRTILDAQRTAYTAYVAHGAQLGALVMVAAADKDILVKGHYGDKSSGAGGDALAAGLALVGKDFGHTVFHFDGAVGAHRFTGAESETAVAAHQRTSLYLGSGYAVVYSAVLKLLLSVYSARAVDMSHLSDDLSRLLTHDGGDLFSHFGSAYGTGIYRGLALD